MQYTLRASQTREFGGREAVLLENGLVRALIDRHGGMVPEFSIRRGAGFLNTHWIPPFRREIPSDADPLGKSGTYWLVPLLENIAGNFPCVPTFGGGEGIAGGELPPHGWTANGIWSAAETRLSENGDAVFAVSRMAVAAAPHSFSFGKTDFLRRGENALYTVLEVRNDGMEPVEINVAWHNTIGSPFLESGCRISSSARRWAAAPEGGEFDPTGRLAFSKEFGELRKSPLRSGGYADLTEVPGPIGHSDFVTGAVPDDAPTGWSACVNPRLRLAYVTWFPGPANSRDGELPLNFNDLWMNYGGRNFTPWALRDGGTDVSFCLGMENSTGAWANGLADSIRRKELLGKPTTVRIEAGQTLSLPYATGIFDLPQDCDPAPLGSIEATDRALKLLLGDSTVEVDADGAFAYARKIRKVL